MTEQLNWTEGIWNYLDCSHTVAVRLKSLKLNYTLLLTVSLVISLENQSWIRTNSKHKDTKVLLVFHNWKDIYSFYLFIYLFSCMIFFILFFLIFILFLNFTLLYWFCQISKWIRHNTFFKQNFFHILIIQWVSD